MTDFDLFAPERLLTIPAAVIPGIALLIFFYKRDYYPEPRDLLIKTFLLGVAATILVVIPEELLSLIRGLLIDTHPLIIGGFTAFGMAAIPEEGMKFLVLTRYSAKKPAFDEPMDGVVYGATMALGLAAVENLYYVMDCYHTAGCQAWQRALLRGVFSVPAHALFGASMGYFVGRAKFVRRRWHLAYLVPASLVVPWVFHGVYDNLCSYVGATSGWIALGAISLAMWVFVALAITRALRRSPFKPGHGEGDGDGDRDANADAAEAAADSEPTSGR